MYTHLHADGAADEADTEESARTCPICLDVAPRQTITVCGHHFCSDCIHECAQPPHTLYCRECTASGFCNDSF